MRFRPLLATFLLLIAVQPHPARAGTSCFLTDAEASAQKAEAESRLLEGLEVLWYGTPDERLDMVRRASWLFRPICHKPGPTDDTFHAEAMASLTRYLAFEADDWIRTRLLQGIAGMSRCPSLNTLFLDALSHTSPNVRRVAARWFAGNGDNRSGPSLEDLWRRDPPAWMRADLLRALSKQRRAGSFKDLLQLSADGDPDVALAAVEALADVDDPRVVEAIAPVIDGGPLRLSLAAIEGLQYWDEDPRALDVLIDASRNGPAAVRRAALAALEDFEDPAAPERLIEALGDTSDLEARILAAHALGEGYEHPGATGALLDVLRESRDGATDPLRRAAICALQEIDDASILPAVIALPHDAADPSDPLTELIAYLRGDPDAGWSCFMLEPPDPFIAEDPGDPRTLCVLPPKDTESVRCWQRPGVAGPPRDFPRLPAGWPALPEDAFERDGELWVLVDGLVQSECWVPRRLLEACPQPAWLSTAEVLRIGRSEFDLPTPLLEAGPLAFLVERGLLRIIDPSEEVTGVALAFEPGIPLAEVVAGLPPGDHRPVPGPEAFARMEILLRRFRDEPLMGPAPSPPPGAVAP